jgi:hypothetical protein
MGRHKKKKSNKKLRRETLQERNNNSNSNTDNNTDINTDNNTDINTNINTDNNTDINTDNNTNNTDNSTDVNTDNNMNNIDNNTDNTDNSTDVNTDNNNNTDNTDNSKTTTDNNANTTKTPFPQEDHVIENVLRVLCQLPLVCKKLVDVPDNTVLYVFGIKYAFTKYRNPILACREDLKQGDISLYIADDLIADYINKNRDKWSRIGGQIKYLHYDTDYYGDSAGSFLFKFRKIGFRYNKQRNRRVYIEILDNGDIQGNSIKTLSISCKDCPKIDHLINKGTIRIGDTITITGQRDLQKLLLFEIIHRNETHKVCANSWLKQIFREEKQKYTNNIPIFDCVVGTEKYAYNNKIQEYTFTKVRSSK